MPQFKSKDPWNAEQEAWLLKSLAHGISQADLYRILTGKQPGLPEDVEPWTGLQTTFRKRIRTLTGANPGIKKTRQGAVLESEEFLDPSPSDISDLDAQTTWLSNFVTRNTKAKPGDRLRALQMLRELQDRLDTEQSGNMRIEADPRLIDTPTSELFEEVIVCGIQELTPEQRCRFIVTFLSTIPHEERHTILNDCERCIPGFLDRTAETVEERQARLLSYVRNLGWSELKQLREAVDEYHDRVVAGDFDVIEEDES